jgi:hypothetical protein
MSHGSVFREVSKDRSQVVRATSGWLSDGGEQRRASYQLAAVFGQAPADHDMRLASRDWDDLAGRQPAGHERRATGGSREVPRVLRRLGLCAMALARLTCGR